MAEPMRDPGNENRIARLVPADQKRAVAQESVAPPPAYGYGYSNGSDEQDLTRELLEYWQIFYKRKWLIAAIVLACVALAGLRTLMMTPLYTATVRIQIDREAPKVVEGGNVTPTETGFDYLKTEYERLQSRTMAERVASSLDLGQDESFLQPHASILGTIRGLLATPDEDEVPDPAARERAAAGVILNNRSVRPVPGSRIVDVSYT